MLSSGTAFSSKEKHLSGEVAFSKSFHKPFLLPWPQLRTFDFHSLDITICESLIKVIPIYHMSFPFHSVTLLCWHTRNQGLTKHQKCVSPFFSWQNYWRFSGISLMHLKGRSWTIWSVWFIWSINEQCGSSNE